MTTDDAIRMAHTSGRSASSLCWEYARDDVLRALDLCCEQPAGCRCYFETEEA